MSDSNIRWSAAIAGMSAALFGLGIGEALAALIAPTFGPFAVIGGTLIDLAPAWAKDLAIAWFGTGDKLALLTGISIVLLLFSAVAGLLQVSRRPWGAVLLGALGLVATALSFTRAGSSMLTWVPSLVAGIAAAWGLVFLSRRLLRSRSRLDQPAHPIAARPPQSIAATEPLNRRRFLVWTGSAAVIGALGVAAGSISRAGVQAASAIRTALRLPKPAVVAAPIPSGAELNVAGISPLVTPTSDFYRIDTALAVPRLDPSSWELRIHGLVENEVRLTWNELLELPLEESYTTLMCVSNQVGGDLIGNAKWLGYPLRHLLERAGVQDDADMVLSRSSDGFTASTPLEALTDDRNSILAIAMNDEPLPPEHGFPVRMVVPGLYGYVSATKWVVELEVTRFDQATAYWTDRGWSERGPVKLQSRIDVPRPGTKLSVGDTVIAGVAWQQHVGINAVEVQIDDGAWQPAAIAEAISNDTWVQWSYPWSATPGQHTVRARATNANGEVQTAEVALPAPNGATGQHEVRVTVND